MKNPWYGPLQNNTCNSDIGYHKRERERRYLKMWFCLSPRDTSFFSISARFLQMPGCICSCPLDVAEESLVTFSHWGPEARQTSVPMLQTQWLTEESMWIHLPDSEACWRTSSSERSWQMSEIPSLLFVCVTSCWGSLGVLVAEYKPPQTALRSIRRMRVAIRRLFMCTSWEEQTHTGK